MDWLRTIGFSLFFYGLSMPMVICCPVAALFGREALRGYANRWLALLRWSARVFLRIETRIEGAIPPGPPANSSPLVLGSALQPLPPGPPDDNRIIPNRPPGPAALGNGYVGPNGEVLPAGGPPEDGAFPPFRRRPEPQPKQLPSPFAPKGEPPAAVPTPKLPVPVPPAAASAAGAAAAASAGAAALSWEIAANGAINTAARATLVSLRNIDFSLRFLFCDLLRRLRL